MLELQTHQGYLTSMLDEDGTTVLLWACGQLLVWDAICPDCLLAISHNQCSRKVIQPRPTGEGAGKDLDQ